MTANNNPSSKRLDGVTGRTATSEEVAQRDGYVQGRNDEYAAQSQMREQERALSRSQASSNEASGILAGLMLALLATGFGAALYFLVGDRTLPNPVAAPQTEKETIREKETTIIEREAPTSDVSLPDVQINVPEVNLPEVNLGSDVPADAGSAEEGSAAPKAAPTEETPPTDANATDSSAEPQ